MKLLDWLQAKDVDAAIEKEGEEQYQRKQDRQHAAAFHLLLLVLALDLFWFRPHVLKQYAAGDIDLLVILFAFYAWEFFIPVTVPVTVRVEVKIWLLRLVLALLAIGIPSIVITHTLHEVSILPHTIGLVLMGIAVLVSIIVAAVFILLFVRINRIVVDHQ